MTTDTAEENPTVLRAFRFCLDPTDAQRENLGRFAGTARFAYNHAIAAKQAAHQEWNALVAARVEAGQPEAEARKQVKVPIPTKPGIYKAFVQDRGDSRTDTEGVCPWWWEVNSYVFQSAFIDADTAWKNWISSFKGTRAGRRVGYPRFKKKGRARDSFRLHHDVKRPSIRLATYRRLNLPRIGEVRLHESAKTLARMMNRGEAVIQSVTVGRGGDRWYASVLCKVTRPVPGRQARTHPDRPNTRQRLGGFIAADLGSHKLAYLSQPLTPGAEPHIDHPRHAKHAQAKLTRAQQAFSRTKKGSNRRTKAARRIGRIHHLTAERRASSLHVLTKQLATGFATVAIEDLDLPALTRSAKGTPETPGTDVALKALFNRHLLDASLGEVKRQLTYKTQWYGSQLVVLDKAEPVNSTCHQCGTRNPSVRPGDSKFRCVNLDCGHITTRHGNTLANIRRAAHAKLTTVAPGTGETQNARRAPGTGTTGPEATTREDPSP